MTQEYLDKMGNWFEYHNILERYDVTFHDCLFLIQNDLWEDFKSSRGVAV